MNLICYNQFYNYRWSQRAGASKMKILNNIFFSLKGRLILCLFVSTLGMATIMIHSFVTSWNSAHDEAYTVFDIAGNTMEKELGEYLANYEEVATKAGYSIAVQSFLLSDNPETVIISDNMALELLSDLIDMNSSCKNIYLFADTDRYICANRSYLPEIREMLDKRRFTEDVTMSNSFYTTFTTSEKGEEKTYVLYAMPIYSILSSSVSNRVICVLVCDMGQIADIIPGMETIQNGNTILLYDNKITSSYRNLTQEENAVIDSIDEGQGKISINKVKYLTSKISLPEEYWDFIYIVPEKSITSRSFSLLNKALLPLGILFLFIVIIISMLIYSINNGIKQIVDDINELEYDNEQKISKIRTPNLIEIQEISHSTNHMLDRLDTSFKHEQEMQKKLLEAVKAQGTAELQSYRSQINPHFLFNTLECIRSMAHSSKNLKIESIISSMALMFRYSVYSNITVPLKQEMNNVKNYINVMNLRFSGMCKLKMHIDQGLENWPVLSMLLQPLVENSISHGFFDKENQNNYLLVKAFYDKGEDRLVIRIADNGEGMEPHEIDTLYQSFNRPDGENSDSESNIGLHNIFSRMKIAFGERFKMIIKSKKGLYTVIELHVPKNIDPIISKFSVNKDV